MRIIKTEVNPNMNLPYTTISQIKNTIPLESEIVLVVVMIVCVWNFC